MSRLNTTILVAKLRFWGWVSRYADAQRRLAVKRHTHVGARR